MDNNFDNLENFRQIPGTKLYRHANPDYASEADVKKLQALGIRALVDLRNPKEVNSNRNVAKVYISRGPDDESGAVNGAAAVANGSGQQETTTGANGHDEQQTHYFNVDVLDSPEMRQMWQETLQKLQADSYMATKPPLAAMYLLMLEYSGQNFIKVLQLLSEGENLPAGFFCFQGKDRTGLTAMLIQSIIGWDRDRICKDYDATGDVIDRCPGIARIVKEKQKRDKDTGKDTGIAVLFTEIAHYEIMADLLKRIDEKYGSVSGYLDSMGFGAGEREKLKNAVIIHEA